MSVTSQPTRYGLPWARYELILAFDLYCRIPFKKTKRTNPAVIELAGLLDRSPSSVARKLGNFGAFDPELRNQNISGLGHGSKLDNNIWDEFNADWNGLVWEAAEIRSNFEVSQAELVDLRVEADFVQPSGDSEVRRMATQRRHQAFFREAVISSYGGRCCISGLPVTECLVASHIVPWSKNENARSDPSNGLCLHSLADRLFDTGLLTVTCDLKVRICNALTSSSDEAIQKYILPMNNCDIRRPHRFMPKNEYLAWHGANLFQN